MNGPSDHDLLIRIDERVARLVKVLDQHTVQIEELYERTSASRGFWSGARWLWGSLLGLLGAFGGFLGGRAVQ